MFSVKWIKSAFDQHSFFHFCYLFLSRNPRFIKTTGFVSFRVSVLTQFTPMALTSNFMFFVFNLDLKPVWIFHNYLTRNILEKFLSRLFVESFLLPFRQRGWCSRSQMIPDRKRSLNRTANDPQSEPQIIPRQYNDRTTSSLSALIVE